MKAKSKTIPSGNNDESAEHLSQAQVHARIEKKAYDRWMADGCRHGQDLRYWLEAESEVLEELRKNGGLPRS